MNPSDSKSKSKHDKPETTIRSLGTWIFDKRSRKRKYISLTGKVMAGPDALRQSRADQYSESHPAQQCRMELCLLQSMLPVDEFLRIFSERSSPTAPASTIIHQPADTLKLLSAWGLPEAVLRRYHTARITELFPWQIECLLCAEGQVFAGQRNMVYTAPTSGGKTLVAELLMLRKLASTMSFGDPKCQARRTIFFVVPFIALADEKLSYFQYMWQDMNIGVKGYHQDDGTATNEVGEDVEIVVCTIERANILFTHLLEMRREEQLSMVVIDEIHLLSDKQRGFLLEVLLSKVKYILGERVQIIGMSATLPNIQDLATWLDATLYMTTFRPVALATFVCENRVLYEALVQPSASAESAPSSSSVAVSSVAANVVPAVSSLSSSATVAAAVAPRQSTRAPMAAASPATNHKITTTDTDDGGGGDGDGDGDDDLDASLDDAAIMAVMRELNPSLPSPPRPGNLPTTTAAASLSSLASSSSSSMPPLPLMPPPPPPPPSMELRLRETRSLPPVTKDDDGLLRLCLDTLTEERSALVFCNSKHRCEVVAKKIADAVRFQRQQQQHQQQQQQQALAGARAAVPPPNIAATFRPPPMATMASSSSSSSSSSASASAASFSSASIPGVLSTATATASAPLNNPFAITTPSTLSLLQNRAQRVHSQRQQLMEHLRQLSVGLCPILRETLPWGIAYHHAGLTQDERTLLEHAFRGQEVVKLLVTTSTLSAGVNLPAHRVILRGLAMGDKGLSVATFRQMCGRAGRTGLDVTGEAIVVLEGTLGVPAASSGSGGGSGSGSGSGGGGGGGSGGGAMAAPPPAVPIRIREQRHQLAKLLTSPLDPLQSSLREGYGGGIEKLLLEMIVCRRLTHEAAVLPFMHATLFATQYPADEVVIPAVKQALVFLRREQFVQNVSQGILQASPLGKATTLAGLSPQDAVYVLPSLIHAKHRLLLTGSHTLHVIYLITPIATATSMTTTLEPRWTQYEQLLDTLYHACPDCEPIAEYLGITRAQAHSFRFTARPSLPSHHSRSGGSGGSGGSSGGSSGSGGGGLGSVEDVYIRYKRFYNAVLLFLMMEEWPLTKVLALYEDSHSSSSGGGGGGSGGSGGGGGSTAHGDGLGGGAGGGSSGSSIGRGRIQQLQRDASVFGTMLTTFCTALNWPLLAAALQDCHKKLCYGTHRSELVPLMRLGVELMPAPRAKLLWQQGIVSPELLLTVPTDQLAHWLLASLPYQERDVLDLVAQHPTAGSGGGGSSGGGGGGGGGSGGSSDHERARHLLFVRAHRLAQSILARADAYVREDLRRHTTSSTAVSS